jgi:diphthine synthase
MVFVGLGLNDEKGMSLEGLEAARQADRVFAEFYTSIMPNLRLSELEDMIGKKVEVLSRTQLEDENGKRILSSAERERVTFLVPGDPMIATTHVTLRLALARRGIESKIIHAASIFSAVCGATGLQSYKFGKSTTLPRDEPTPPSVLDTIKENRMRNLHTLLLLELKANEKAQLTIGAATSKLIQANPELAEWLTVGVARLGSPTQQVRAGKASKFATSDHGSVPHTLVFPGRLHFMEAEALKAFAGATDSDLEGSM